MWKNNLSLPAVTVGWPSGSIIRRKAERSKTVLEICVNIYVFLFFPRLIYVVVFRLLSECQMCVQWASGNCNSKFVKIADLESNFKYHLTSALSRLLHLIDPFGQPTITASRDHCFCTHVRPSPLFKSNTTIQKNNGETVGLAEWIIDDTCLVFCIFPLTSSFLMLR